MTQPSLEPAHAHKPLDFGIDGLTGSIDHNGGLIALSTFHPVHGYITLNAAEPFPDSARYNPPAVRAYRRELAALWGYGFAPTSTVTNRSDDLDGSTIVIRLTTAHGAIESRTQAVTIDGINGVIQDWTLAAPAHWGGQLCLQRCAYTQLTEGGPIPQPPVKMQLRFDGSTLTIENPALETTLAVTGFPLGGEPWTRGATGLTRVELPIFEPQTVRLAYAFGATPTEATANARTLWSEKNPAPPPWETALASVENRLVKRGLRYGMQLAIPNGEGACILTDHMLLPLVWNRDAYFVARALLSWGQPDAVEVVRRHLLWMFEQAERPKGFWGRCYLANGRVKDGAFQLDQQLFPLLQLAEYTLETGDRATLERLTPHIAPLIAHLLELKAPEDALFPTEETAADDPISEPYPLSSHILFWRTLMLLEKAGVPGEWRSLAESIRAAVDRHFIAQHGGQTLYAYATDGEGGVHFYHDANDFPLVLAPAWGFVSADDPVWRATIAFAWSPDNEGGVYDGRLGSVHTPAPWPLGDVQEMIAARALGDIDRVNRARANIERAAQWDGALPEATEPDTGAVVSRTWFAWPNAAYACFKLGAFDQ